MSFQTAIQMTYCPFVIVSAGCHVEISENGKWVTRVRCPRSESSGHRAQQMKLKSCLELGKIKESLRERRQERAKVLLAKGCQTYEKERIRIFLNVGSLQHSPEQ